MILLLIHILFNLSNLVQQMVHIVSDLIAYDLNTNPKIIWSSDYYQKINRVNFDGTGFQLLIVDNNPYGVDISSKWITHRSSS